MNIWPRYSKIVLIWASHVWNMFDFLLAAARKEGGVAGRNNKGLVTIDRKIRKDSFAYQAFLSKVPMVHIAGRRYAQRAGQPQKSKFIPTKDEVTLYLNGKRSG